MECNSLWHFFLSSFRSRTSLTMISQLCDRCERSLTRDFLHANRERIPVITRFTCRECFSNFQDWQYSDGHSLNKLDNFDPAVIKQIRVFRFELNQNFFVPSCHSLNAVKMSIFIASRVQWSAMNVRWCKMEAGRHEIRNTAAVFGRRTRLNVDGPDWTSVGPGR